VNNLKNKNVIAGLINYYRQQQSCGKRKKTKCRKAPSSRRDNLVLI